MAKKRTKALEPSTKTRKEVKDRDRYCIFCGATYPITIAHYISRAHGGLGIKENLCCVCLPCHRRLDQSEDRQVMLKEMKAYLNLFYPNFSDKDREYKK